MAPGKKTLLRLNKRGGLDAPAVGGGPRRKKAKKAGRNEVVYIDDDEDEEEDEEEEDYMYGFEGGAEEEEGAGARPDRDVLTIGTQLRDDGTWAAARAMGDGLPCHVFAITTTRLAASVAHDHALLDILGPERARKHGLNADLKDVPTTREVTDRLAGVAFQPFPTRIRGAFFHFNGWERKPIGDCYMTAAEAREVQFSRVIPQARRAAKEDVRRLEAGLPIPMQAAAAAAGAAGDLAYGAEENDWRREREEDERQRLEQEAAEAVAAAIRGGTKLRGAAFYKSLETTGGAAAAAVGAGAGAAEAELYTPAKRADRALSPGAAAQGDDLDEVEVKEEEADEGENGAGPKTIGIQAISKGDRFIYRVQRKINGRTIYTGETSDRFLASVLHDLVLIDSLGPQAARDKGLNIDIEGGYRKTVVSGRQKNLHMRTNFLFFLFAYGLKRPVELSKF
jgi:hypothetical protein